MSLPLKSLNYTLLSQTEIDGNGLPYRRRRWSEWTIRDVVKWAVPLLVLLGLGIGIAVRQVHMNRDGWSDCQGDLACPQYPVLTTESQHVLRLEEELTQHLTSASFKEASVTRLQGAVRIPTESYDDMGKVGEDTRWEIFKEFHAYLEKTFPQVWSKLEIETVNTYGLVITWPGQDESLKPYMFMAHQDVVPVPASTVARWTYEPYSAHYDGRFIWGRGSTDCKNNLIGVLEAFETLLEKGFQPQRTILAGFGADEEISGFYTAALIAPHLEEKWGKGGLDLIIDEGGMGITDMYGTTFALPALGEKGYFDVKITVETAGGHSSVPADHTGIGYLAQIINTIEAHPYTPSLTPRNPYYTTLQCAAEYGPDMDSWLRKTILAARKSKKAAQQVAQYLAEHNIVQRYLMQTSQAVDLINGGVKINALPEKVSAVVNHRVAVESSVSSVRERMTSLLEDTILSKYDLSLNSWGKESGNLSEAAKGSIFLEDFDAGPLEPSPVSPFDSDAYKIFSGTIKQVLGGDIIVAPQIMTGNTDTKYYWNLTKNIYRFSAVREGGRADAHTVDEKMGADEHVEGVRFYTQIILNGDRK